MIRTSLIRIRRQVPFKIRVWLETVEESQNTVQRLLLMNFTPLPFHQKKRKICDNEQIKDFRTSFRIINTAESHVKSLRAQVRELHQQKRRLHKRLLEKNEKLKQYEHIASDRKKEKSMVEKLSKRRANKEIMAVLLLNQVYYLLELNCFCFENFYSYLIRLKI